MINLKLSFGFILVLTLFIGSTYSQDAVELGGPGLYLVGDSCAGAGNIKYDDGTFENGYGWSSTVSDGRTVMKFTPPSYPWNFTKVCVALTRTASGSANFTTDIVFYDTTGSGGIPGATPVYSLLSQTVTSIPIYPQYAWYNFTVSPPALANGSYYVGLKFIPNGSGQTFKYLMADQSTSTTLRPGYGWANAGPWTPLATYFPQYRAMGIRTEGSGGPPAGGIVLNICRVGINVAVPDNNPSGTFDSIRVLGNDQCTITDVNVKIDTFNHTWISDMQFKLTHNGATNTNLFLNRGGSGDNLRGTIFNDSAAQPISAGTAPFTGSWRPETPLSVYNGQAPAGRWELFMVDQFAGDLGFLRNWCITWVFNCPTGGIKTLEVPFTYRLSQNYPNPFNPTTTIKYGLPRYGNTKLVVYDALGRVVTTLVNEFKDAGTYEVTFDASSYSSGVYFYTLESGNFKETKKMLLVK